MVKDQGHRGLDHLKIVLPKNPRTLWSTVVVDHNYKISLTIFRSEVNKINANVLFYKSFINK
jgi:hypothetical protein